MGMKIIAIDSNWTFWTLWARSKPLERFHGRASQSSQLEAARRSPHSSLDASGTLAVGSYKKGPRATAKPARDARYPSGIGPNSHFRAVAASAEQAVQRKTGRDHADL